MPYQQVQRNSANDSSVNANKVAGVQIVSSTGAILRTYTLPDAGANDTFVFLGATQTFTNKKFSGAQINTDSFFADVTTATKNLFVDLSASTAVTKTTLKFNQTVNRTVTFPDATDTVAVLGQAQTFSAAQTFTSTITASNLTGTNTGDITLAASDIASNANGATLSGQVLTLQAASINFPGVVTAGAQTFGGVKTFANSPVFSAPINLNAINNQLVLGQGTATMTIGCFTNTMTAPRNYTIPSIDSNASFVLNVGDQTLGGNNTFSLAILAGNGVTASAVNANLPLSGNGTGVVMIGATGQKFTNATASYVPTALTYYEEVNYTGLTFTYGALTSTNNTISVVRCGVIVVVYINTVASFASGTTTSTVVSPTFLDARFCPINNLAIQGTMIIGGVATTGRVVLTAGGLISVQTQAGGGIVTSAQTLTLEAYSFSYRK